MTTFGIAVVNLSHLADKHLLYNAKTLSAETATKQEKTTEI